MINKFQTFVVFFFLIIFATSIKCQNVTQCWVLINEEELSSVKGGGKKRLSWGYLGKIKFKLRHEVVKIVVISNIHFA